MKQGLVLGKFMPVHKGHLALIEFAQAQCDKLTVLLCYHNDELIKITLREKWMREVLADKPNVSLVTLSYNPNALTDSSEPLPEYAKAWAQEIKKQVPEIDVLFSSEEYGTNLAFYLNAQHISFDNKRNAVPVSANLIRTKPLTYWEFLPRTVQPYFVKKVMLLGSESTGKSTLAKKLAAHYHTSFVPEMAREVIEHTEECTYADLWKIAELHARAILAKTEEANKLLFCDTDATITKSYSLFLFNKKLELPVLIEEANRGDLYLFLDIDCPFVQDGTRLPQQERALLNESHKRQLNNAAISYQTITGNWDERFAKACIVIDEFISKY